MSSLPEYCSESEGMVIEDSVKGLTRSSEDIAGFWIPCRRHTIRQCSMCACQLDVDAEWRYSRVEALVSGGKCRARLKSSWRAAGLTFLCAFTRSLCQFNVNSNIFCPLLPQGYLLKHFKHPKGNLRSSHNNDAIMTDHPSHDELISQFVDLTGASPADVSNGCSTRPSAPKLTLS